MPTTIPWSSSTVKIRPRNLCPGEKTDLWLRRFFAKDLPPRIPKRNADKFAPADPFRPITVKPIPWNLGSHNRAKTPWGAIGPICSKDKSRESINGIFYDCDGLAVATDGRRLVSVPIENFSEVPKGAWGKIHDKEKIIEATYPRWRTAVPSLTDYKFFTLTEEILAAFRANDRARRFLRCNGSYGNYASLFTRPTPPGGSGHAPCKDMKIDSNLLCSTILALARSGLTKLEIGIPPEVGKPLMIRPFLSDDISVMGLVMPLTGDHINNCFTTPLFHG